MVEEQKWRVTLKWTEVALEVGVVEMEVEVVLLRVVVLTAAGGLLAHHEPSGEGEEGWGRECWVVS